MKRTDWIVMIAALGFSCLFYHQWPGLNYLVFTLLLIVLQVLCYEREVITKAWIGAAFCCLLSAVNVAWHASAIAITGNILALCVLAFVPLGIKALPLAWANAFFSFLMSPLLIVDEMKIRRWTPGKEIQSPGPRIVMTIAAVLVIIVFIFIYRAANPAFKELTNYIDLSFISFGWILLTLIGVLLSFAFFFPRQDDSFRRVNAWPYSIPEPKPDPASFVTLRSELKTGLFLFSVLNLLLFTVNFLDVIYLYMGHESLQGVSNADAVHQSVGLLIFSIVLAILLILYFFRGALNFHAERKWILNLAYLWILQNLLLVIATGYRNELYIVEFGLTAKRIGVFVYLLLTVFGLLSTFVKLQKLRNFWFLIKVNSMAGFITLIVAGCLNWSLFISQYNINWAAQKGVSPDIAYLFELSWHNTAELITLLEEKPELKNEYFTNALEERIKDLRLRNNEYSVLSRSWDDYKAWKRIEIKK